MQARTRIMHVVQQQQAEINTCSSGSGSSSKERMPDADVRTAVDAMIQQVYEPFLLSFKRGMSVCVLMLRKGAQQP